MAKQFFNGNTAAAATAVYNYRKPLETPSANKSPTVTSPAASTTSLFGNPSAVKTPTAVQPSIAGSGTINIPGGKPDVNTAIKNAFSSYKTQGAGYTEKVVLPQIANQYFNGDVKAASAPVYQYRTATFGS